MKEPKFTPGPLIVCPAYADNGALSHYELRRKETGELVVEVGAPYRLRYKKNGEVRAAFLNCRTSNEISELVHRQPAFL